MDKLVKLTISIKAPPEVGREAMLAAMRKLREGGHQHMITDPGHCHTISDPNHTHGIIMPTLDRVVVDPEAEMRARNLMTVRALPCERE